jgi:F-type H+-transporting ATPase subunit gamma
MAGLRELRGRIKSIKNTRKITYAMKLVSATKLRKSQEASQMARAYSSEIWSMLGQVLAIGGDSLTHPLTAKRTQIKRVCLLVVSANRGLCGAYNSNVNKAVLRYMKQRTQEDSAIEFDAIILGRKAAEFFRAKRLKFSKSYEELSEDPVTWPVTEVCEDLEIAYQMERYDQVVLVYTQAKSALSMSVKIDPILPFNVGTSGNGEQDSLATEDSLFKPNLQAVFTELVPRAMRTKVRQACLEAKASEHGARMTAMDSATKNAGDLTKKLTLKLNKLRQSGITGEILDIVGGAEAIK